MKNKVLLTRKLLNNRLKLMSILIFVTLFTFTSTVYSESELSETSKLPIIIEATSGETGNEWEIKTDRGISYVTITTDYNETTGQAGYPGANRVLSYEVTFPAPGEYDLFAKVRVGSSNFDDDSFFYGNGFGEKDPGDEKDWLIVNGIAAGGFDSDLDLVKSELGGLGSEVWKWINISQMAFHAPVPFTWEVGEELTQTLQIGAREDGLDIAKFAFGRSDLYFTVEQLETGKAGTETDPTFSPPEDLEPIAKNNKKWLGNVYSSSQVPDFNKYWNQVIPENAGKWGYVEAVRDQMSWHDMDKTRDLAIDNGFPLQFHVLVWGNQQPAWLNDLTPEEQLLEVEEWFNAVNERYGEDITYLQVVNEPIHDPAKYKDALGGDGKTGWDWIIKSFEMAREIFPSHVKLMINDYGIVGSNINTTKYLTIINLLKDRNLIDAIGVQSHAFTTKPASTTALKSSLDRLAETGLPIQATEFEIDGNPNGTNEQSDLTQLNEYKRIFPIFWEHPAVEGMTLWGWKPGLWRHEQEAFLIRSNGEERPALTWLREYVESTNTAIDNLLSDKSSQFVLYDNFPNPFNSVTQIEYKIPTALNVKITIYDMMGRQIKTLINKSQPAGKHTVIFDANELPAGIYLYKMEAGSFTTAKKLMLIK